MTKSNPEPKVHLDADPAGLQIQKNAIHDDQWTALRQPQIDSSCLSTSGEVDLKSGLDTLGLLAGARG